MQHPSYDATQPLLLLPGLLCDRALWTHQIDHLADIADIMVPDLTDQDSIDAMASHVLSQAPDRFALAGLSMGGYVALSILRLAPDRVTRLCLLDTNARADSDEQIRRRGALVTLARTGRFKGVTPRLLPTLVHADHVNVPEIGGVVLAMAERVGRDAFCRQQQAILSRPDSRPFLPSIQVPTLCIVGRDDQISPPDRAQEMADAIAGASIAVIDHCGHMAPLEQPAITTSRMREWLTRP